MHCFTLAAFWIVLHWKTAFLIAGTVAGAAILKHYVETDEARAQRIRRVKMRELRVVADNISTYGRKIHQRYPTGDVVVSERDLAQQLRKRPEIVATALEVLLVERKAQRASLSGYWKLNV